MTETLPARDSSQGHSVERLDVAGDGERRMTTLFRRWPSLNNRETSELRRLWAERIRRAKQRRRS